MTWFILFLFGLAIGSFLNVVALRYDGEHFLFDPREIGGRSRCPHCRKTLRWFELIPLVSWVAQHGRCRHCHTKIGWRYPAVELLSGILFVTVPLRLSVVSYLAAHPAELVGFSAIWIIALELLLLIAYIDILLSIVPDELNIALLILGIVEIGFIGWNIGSANPSFFGGYAAIFGLQASVWLSHIVGALFGVIFFGAIVAITRGKGMGMGDVKLALPLGLLFGWPDILMIALMAFVIGGAFGVFVIALGRKTMKSAVPFAPFLVAASVIAFFWGSAIFNWYFRMIGL